MRFIIILFCFRLDGLGAPSGAFSCSLLAWRKATMPRISANRVAAMARMRAMTRTVFMMRI